NDVSMTMKFVFIAAGLLFALLGNNMYNMQPNYFAGIRLPWTLESEDNWRKTHHLAGRLWFFGGLLFAIIVLFLNNKWAGYSGAVILAILILIPVFYSYKLYRSQTKKSRV
ncbi:MAG: SdpI family protein, partial [Parafilimonas sp.]